MRFIVLLVLLNLYSCKSHENSSNQNFHNIHFNNEIAKTLEFDKLVVDSKLINLESDRDYLIGNIDKVLVYDDIIYILDNTISNKIFKFGLQGDFIGSFNLIGKGPAEVLSIDDFIIKGNSNEIWIYDGKNKRIYIYSLEGIFKSYFDIGISFASFELIGNDTLLTFNHSTYNYLNDYGEIPYDYIVIDKNKKVLNKQFFNSTELNKGITKLVFENYFSKNNQEIYLNWIFSNTIFKVRGLEAIPFVTLDFGNKSITDDIINSESNKSILIKINNEKYSSVMKPVKVANNKMLISIYTGGDMKGNWDEQVCVLDLNDESISVFSSFSGFPNNTFNFPISTYKDYFISVLPVSPHVPENAKLLLFKL
jgi:hypothetical protein